MRLSFLGFTLLFVMTAFSQSSTLNRPFDPMVITGNNLPAYGTLLPGAIVGFRYVNSEWLQIPVQVDEKAVLDMVAPYGPYAADKGLPPPTGVNALFYTDAGTYTGADPDNLFDADDELVFMLKDAGAKSPGTSAPPGIVGGTCTEVMITDPLGGVGYVYLYQQDGSLQQGAGKSYVNYSFRLANNGTYPQNFTFIGARNNENSTVTTSNYSWRFSAEWISDEIKIATGGAANTDILDRHKSFFSGNCVRSEDTFSDGDNAFVTNKSGPVRAIRSYMGANSGPLTQRTHFFYQGRQDIITDLRVHNIANIYDAFDYNSNANGMRYRNNLNPGGVIINGSKDAVTLGDIKWEMASGSKGTIVALFRRKTNLSGGEATFTSYYDDNKTKPNSNCTGDGQAWGTSGIGTTFNSLVCTEPLKESCGSTSNFRQLQLLRQLYFESPSATLSTATTYNDQYNNPVQVTYTNIGQSLSVSKSSITPLNENTLVSTVARIFPNPASRSFTIAYTAATAARVEILLFNSLGTVLMNTVHTAQKGTNYFQVITKQAPPGIYMVTVCEGMKRTNMKLMIQ